MIGPNHCTDHRFRITSTIYYSFLTKFIKELFLRFLAFLHGSFLSSSNTVFFLVQPRILPLFRAVFLPILFLFECRLTLHITDYLLNVIVKAQYLSVKIVCALLTSYIFVTPYTFWEVSQLLETLIRGKHQIQP